MLIPATDRALLDALAAMRRLVGIGDISEEEHEARIDAYIAELRRYPEDIALHVLAHWHRRSQFWPAWKELQDALDSEFAQRRTMLPAIQQYISLEEANPEQSEAEKAADRERTLAVYAEFCQKMRVQPDPLILKKRFAFDADDRPPAPQTDFEKRLAAREAADRETARLHCAALSGIDTTPDPPPDAMDEAKNLRDAHWPPDEFDRDIDSLLDESFEAVEPWPEPEIGERNS